MLNFRMSGLLYLLVAASTTGACFAQNVNEFPFAQRVLPPQAINIPQVRGATVMSTQVTSFAHLQSSRAQLLTSQAYANLINAHARIANIQASREELKYHAERVSSYFDLREINRQRRAELNPPMHLRAQKADNLLHDLMLKQPEHLLEQSADISGRLNWLIARIISRSFQQGIIERDEGIFSGEHFNLTFSQDELSKIFIEYDGSISGDKFRHRINGANAARAALPPIFGIEALSDKAKMYLQSREQLAGLMVRNDNGLPPIKEWDHVYEKLDSLKATLSSRELLVSLPSRYHRLLQQGKLFVSSQGAALQLALETGNGDYLVGMPVFTGSSLGEMLFFMSQNGYVFSSAGVDGKAVYMRLFHSLRNVYIELN